MLQLFDASSGTIATACMLNQALAVREYSDEDSYRVLRDRLIGTPTINAIKPYAHAASHFFAIIIS